MNSEFQDRKVGRKIQVIITRDSICAGDDCDGPHERTIEIDSLVDLETFVREISSDCLPSVAGIGHSWICKLNEVKIAEIAHSGVRTLVDECPFFSRENRLHFVCHSARF